VQSKGVTAKYNTDPDKEGRGTLRIVGFANSVELPDGTVQKIRRGVYDPDDPMNAEIHPNGNFVDPGINVPDWVPVPRSGAVGNMPLNAQWAGLLKIDLTTQTDQQGNLTIVDGSLMVHGAMDATDARVSLLKGTITEIDTEVFEEHGNLELAANVTHTNSKMPNFGAVLGIQIEGLKKGLSFLQGFHSFGRSASASIQTTSVPEPSSVFAMGTVLVFACCGVIRDRRRKRRVA
jgi:hypothetical protein